MSQISHPFIVGLHYAFQTKDLLYLVLEYCPGGNLSRVLDRLNNLSEDMTKLYCWELILALEELHRRNIIYRDLKPDNIVLNQDGHVKLTDFGLSKEDVHDDVSAQSFWGSTAYLAPEMIRRTGHGKSVDWYLLGVLIYEMLTGIPPFYSSDKKQMMHDICKQPLKIPTYVSKEAQDILFMLWTKDPTKRLGAGRTDAAKIKSHPWFKGIDWDQVYNRKLKMPSLADLSLKADYENMVSTRIARGEDEHSVNVENNHHIEDWSFAIYQ